VTIHWCDGTKQELGSLPVDQTHQVEYPSTSST
jgi:hypothetical protein